MKSPTAANVAFKAKSHMHLPKKEHQWGKDDRFKSPGKPELGPGSYNEPNKWNKRTYNLKFLNI